MEAAEAAREAAESVAREREALEEVQRAEVRATREAMEREKAEALAAVQVTQRLGLGLGLGGLGLGLGLGLGPRHLLQCRSRNGRSLGGVVGSSLAGIGSGVGWAGLLGGGGGVT